MTTMKARGFSEHLYSRPYCSFISITVNRNSLRWFVMICRRRLVGSRGSPASEYLRHRNATPPRELLLDLLARVGVGEVRVKVLVEQLDGLLGEVAALAARVQKAASKVSKLRRYLGHSDAALAC